jgi:hypothetical protein
MLLNSIRKLKELAMNVFNVPFGQTGGSQSSSAKKLDNCIQDNLISTWI